MAVDLIYKHQQKTYELMGKSLEERGRAAYVYPTGCGKTFPALKYIENNSEKSATIVVPSNFIRKQYEKNIRKYVENGEERLKNGSIKIETYQAKHYKAKKHSQKIKILREHYTRLIKEGKSILAKDISLRLPKRLFPIIESDIVVFDEIHRMGAIKWEKVVDQIMNENPKRKVIGMSATPERTNKRNMAYEKFGEDVVYEMSLTEALSGEKEGEVLLKSPNYVRVLSILKSELPKYKEQIEEIEDDEKREKCLKAYQKLDTIVSKSPDIQDIIAAGMKKNNGKYIVFCKDREDMFDKIEHAEEIFGKVNSKINIDYVITKKDGEEDTKGKTKNENDRTLELFETRENGEELNLLFCVDMLNEGVHIDGIDGVVLFDLTSSPILYKQRIGRALSSDKNAGEAVIIDAANNWLAQIETYKEIEMAIQAGHKREQDEKEKDWNSLKLLPEELELIEILREIGEELRYNQGTYLSRALQIKEWCERKYGDKPREERCLPSNREGASEEEKDLAIKLQSVRKRLNDYKGFSLDEIEDEDDREIVKIIRVLDKEYGLSKTLKNAIIIKKWCEEKYGDKPREERSLPGRSENASEEEKKLYSYFVNIRIKQKKYEGISLEEIKDEDDREIVEIIRFLNKEYGASGFLKNVIRIKKWCEEKYGDKPREERYLPSGREGTSEEEKDLQKKLTAIESAIGKKYEGLSLEGIEDEEDREIVEIIRFLHKEYGASETLKDAIRIKKWCEEKYGDKPREERYLPSTREGTSEEEKKIAEKLHYQKIRDIPKRYEGISLEEIKDEDDRQIVEIMRFLYKEYGLSKGLKNAIIIKKWCEEKYGDKPREERDLPCDSEQVSEEEREVAKKLQTPSIRSILKKYESLNLEEIEDEDDKEIVEIIRFLYKEYGASGYLKNAIKIKKWCEEKYGDKPREERYLPSGREGASEEEKDLQKKLNGIESVIGKKYEGLSLEEIEDEDDREIVEIIRFLHKEYGASETLKDAIRIKKWCEEKYGDKPIEERALPSLGKKASKEEKKMAEKLHYQKISDIPKRYEGISLEEIKDEDDREIVEIMRFLYKEYGASGYLKNAIRIKKWCEEKYGDKPREERMLPRKTNDKEEKQICETLRGLRRINDRYVGIDIEMIEDYEHREIAKIIDYLDENFMSEDQKKKRETAIRKKMQKAVGKQVAHNEETRKELEGPDKSLETEEEDVEK